MNHKIDHHKADAGSFKQCLKGRWPDRILLLLMLAAILLLWFQIKQSLGQGVPTAYIYHGRKLLAQYPLPLDERLIQVPAQGEIGISDIEISKQGIRFTSSPCSTHHCTLSGHKSHMGSVIACVPNHIAVVLRGAAPNNKNHITFDAMTE